MSKLNIIAVTDRKFTDNDKTFLGFNCIPISKVQELNPDYIMVATLRYLDLIEELENTAFKNISAKMVPLIQNNIFSRSQGL